MVGGAFAFRASQDETTAGEMGVCGITVCRYYVVEVSTDIRMKTASGEEVEMK